MQIFITGTNGFIGGAVIRLAASFAARRRLTRLQRTASKQSLDRLMMRRCCRPKHGLPMLSSMRPAAITAVQSRR
jgi:nucleoside-diphosphate-sugar epimerase